MLKHLNQCTFLTLTRRVDSSFCKFVHNKHFFLKFEINVNQKYKARFL